MAKFYTVNKVINGKEYTAQFNGISAALDATDNSYIDGSSNISMLKLSKYIFEHVIVDPKIKLDDFGADKIGKEESKEVGGVVYKAKFQGIAKALEALDNNYIEDSNNVSNKKFSEYLFKNIITEPKNLTIDDFDNMDDFSEVVAFARETMQGGEVFDEFNEVVAFARGVMNGDFRDKKNEVATGTEGKK